MRTLFEEYGISVGLEVVEGTLHVDLKTIEPKSVAVCLNNHEMQTFRNAEGIQPLGISVVGGQGVPGGAINSGTGGHVGGQGGGNIGGGNSSQTLYWGSNGAQTTVPQGPGNGEVR